MADLQSARQRTTRKRRLLRQQGVSAEELRARAATLSHSRRPSASGEPFAAATAAPTAPTLTTCPQCGGVGWVRVAEIGQDSEWHTRLAPCACRADAVARERWQRALSASDSTPRLRALSFDGYDPKHNAAALAAAKRWACVAGDQGDQSDQGDQGDQTDQTEQTEQAEPYGLPWLLLYGGPGSGKTHLLAAAFNELLAGSPFVPDAAAHTSRRTRRYPLYTVVPALLDHIREGLNEPTSREYGARFKAVREAPILILDDLGAERSSEWTDELLFKLLDYRYRQALPTAVASNLIPADLEPRIASRLQDRALSTALLMQGPDYRLAARKAEGKAAH